MDFIREEIEEDILNRTESIETERDYEEREYGREYEERREIEREKCLIEEECLREESLRRYDYDEGFYDRRWC